ncbi:hypothetical protein [Propioniciclava soli]|uniref:DUF4175 domain-containing protein n=1 Tax=Propioniciclava soli TaxID=2775081 RepID=A0ABZ3CAI1_9ACTN|nr:hypothetical protein [Propioniciclava soli]
MKTDVTALVLGLVGLLVAGLGLWDAFGTVHWPWVWVGAPVALVIFGLLGLFASRTPP